MAIENYCIDCKAVAQPDCEQHGHIVGTLGESDDGSSEWCDDCRSYTCAPWCPSYEPDDSGEQYSYRATDDMHVIAAPDKPLKAADFASLWSAAPRSRTARIEREDAEWWFNQNRTNKIEPTIEDCVKELREMFPEHEYMRVRIGCSWFGDDNIDTLARIVVTKYEWFGKTLADAMKQVCEWKALQLARDSEDASALNGG